MNLKRQLSSNHIIAISIGVVYLWFGGLKFFPEVSPAEELAKNTITLLTFNLIPSNVSIIMLAIWESLVGLFLIMNIYRQTVIIVALIHIAFTFTPLFLFPEQMFTNAPFQLTLTGQYIIKNLIIAAALAFLYKKASIK